MLRFRTSKTKKEERVLVVQFRLRTMVSVLYVQNFRRRRRRTTYLLEGPR